jgi:signal peptidase II
MPRGKGKIITVISLIVVFVDQLTKFLISNFFYPGQSLPIAGKILSLTFIKNTGAAFGVFKNLTLIFIIFAILVIIYFFYLIFSKQHLGINPYILGLFLGGAIGNLIDRVRLGYVIDFIDFHIWPVFNVSDSAITVSVAWFIIRMIKDKYVSHPI